MEKRKSVIFNNFQLYDTKPSSSVFKTFRSSPYTDDRGYGLKNVDFDDEVLSATLIKRNATFINFYNVQIDDFEKRQIFVFIEVPFVIDFELELIAVFGPASSLNLVKSILKNLMPDTYQINSSELTVYSLYEMMKKKKTRLKIDEVSIQNFSYQDGIIGRYAGRVTNAKVALEIIKQYKDDLNKMVLTVFPDEGGDFTISLGNNGAMAITCEEDDFSQNFYYLKNIIFK